MTATITIHRPDDPHCDADGDLEIWVEGECGHIEAPSRHCPGDPGDVDVQPGPFELQSSRLREPTFVDTVLSRAEERDAEEAIRQAVYSELRGTRMGRRILGTLG